MLSTLKDLYAYRDLLRVLTWKNIVLRYKQSHLGLAWVVLVAAAFPKTIAMLDGLVYRVVPVEATEIGRIDAGLSCMSLRWQRPAE